MGFRVCRPQVDRLILARQWMGRLSQVIRDMGFLISPLILLQARLLTFPLWVELVNHHM